MKASCRFAVVASLIAAFVSPVIAQRGDHEGQPQPEVWKNMDVPPAPVLTPEQAMESFRIAPGFRIELVASEPLMEDPVAMAWDGDGRLYVVEMRGYMPNVDGTHEDKPVGRVSVLEDTDGDGRMDRSTVFLDKLVMPRAVAVVDGGVLVSEPPNLWFCRDTDGDLKCDEKQIVFEKYGAQGPVEHTDNGLMLNLDNWIYNAKSSLRFQFRNGRLLAEPTTFRGQWGIAQDDFGRLYTNHNSSWLHADLIPDTYLRRNPALETGAGTNVRVVKDQSVDTIRVNPGINRGYQDAMLRDDGRLARTTAVSSALIYRGDQFPAEYRGNAFVPEPGGNVVARFMLDNDGLSVTGERQTVPDEQWGKREFLASTDERFRPVNIYNGPDGGLYIVDMYRGILQHKVYVTTFLRKQILERKLDKPVGMGRIWRVVYEGNDVDRKSPNLTQLPSPELVKRLGDDNGWVRDMAQQLLIERGDHAVVPALRNQARSGRNRMAQIHALWTLEGLGAVDGPTIAAAAHADDAWVQIMALRVAGPVLDDPAVQSAVLAAADSKHRGVRLQAMYTLGDLRTDNAFAAMVRLLTEDASQLMRDAAVSGVAGREITLLETLLREPAWAKHSGDRAATLRLLGATIFRSRNGSALGELLNIASDQKPADAWRAAAMLDGVLKAEKKPKPVTLPAKPTALAKLSKFNNKGLADRARQMEKLVTWRGDERQVAGNESKVKPLSAKHQAAFEQGKMLYMATCMACHQPHGKGQAGLAPSLVGSPWVVGPAERLIRIALNGVHGPIEVDGQEWNLIMPGLRDNPIMDDANMAAILTYVRREWGNTGDPVEPALVGKVRKATADRGEPWTVEELKQIK